MLNFYLEKENFKYKFSYLKKKFKGHLLWKEGVQINYIYVEQKPHTRKNKRVNQNRKMALPRL